MRSAIVAAAVLVLGGAAAPASPRQETLESALAGRTPGKTVDCVDLSRLGGPQVIDDKTLIYRESGRRIWRNDLPEACRSLSQMSTLVTDVYGSGLCRNDRFRTIEAGMSIPSSYCRLGGFTPYDKVAKAK